MRNSIRRAKSLTDEALNSSDGEIGSTGGKVRNTVTPMNSNELELFMSLALAATDNLKRLNSARVVDLSTRLAILNYHVLEASKRDESLKKYRFVQLLDKIELDDFKDYQTITQTSYLVHGMAILDSFLTETTSFLFLKTPATLGKKDGVSWEIFLDRKKRINTIVEAANRKARDLAFWPFNRRLEFLEKNFHLKIEIAEDIMAAVIRYISIRNSAVHDHTIIGLTLDERDAIVGCTRDEPTPKLKPGELQLAFYAFSTVIAAIFRGVCDSLNANSSELNEKVDKLYQILNRVESFREK